MDTDLNKKVHSFFLKHNLENITKENIKIHFKNINEQNDYGGLLHAAVHNKFDEDKVLKFMKNLMELGIDVNLCAKSTGYTFIHLALYGYTENNKDYPYSTDFILKIIKLAKKYDFNVNLVDNDGDTIIHTAIASEVYNGRIEPLIDELGQEFNLEVTDNNGNNIYQALLKYKKEAQLKNKNEWLNKLISEEEIIKVKFKAFQSNSDEKKQNDIEYRNHVDTKLGSNKIKVDNDKKKNIKNPDAIKNIKMEIKKYEAQLDIINGGLTINFIIDNYKTIEFIINKINKNIKRAKDEYSCDITSDINNRIMKKINNMMCYYITDISKEMNFETIKKLENIINSSTFLDKDLAKSLVIKRDYLNQGEKNNKKKLTEDKMNDMETLIECKIKNIITLNDLLEIKKEIDNLEDEIIKDNLINIFNVEKNKFIREIDTIKELNNLINITCKWLSKEVNAENILNNLSIKELKQLKEEKCNYLKQLREEVLNSVSLQIKNIINSTDSLIENNVLDKETINECISKIIDKKPKTKINRRGRK